LPRKHADNERQYHRRRRRRRETEKKARKGKEMKKMIIISIIGSFFITFPLFGQTRSWEIRPAYPDFGQPLGSQGSYENPYVVKERWNGDLEIRSRYPDLNRPIGSPGSPENPYIIKPRKW
jgi:hypothetical protein